MTNHIIKLETGHIKLSDVGFLKYSINFFEAENDLKKTEKKHNPVPYFYYVRVLSYLSRLIYCF